MIAVEVPQNEQISAGGKNGRRKGVGSAIRRRSTNRWSVKIKKRDHEELFREMLTPHNESRGQAKKERR